MYVNRKEIGIIQQKKITIELTMKKIDKDKIKENIFV